MGLTAEESSGGQERLRCLAERVNERRRRSHRRFHLMELGCGAGLVRQLSSRLEFSTTAVGWVELEQPSSDGNGLVKNIHLPFSVSGVHLCFITEEVLTFQEQELVRLAITSFGCPDRIFFMALEEEF